jgi:hypothetical protein
MNALKAYVLFSFLFVSLVVAQDRPSGNGNLIVTDRNGLGSKGSCINVKTVDDKLRIELNQKAKETANLKVSSALTSIAILI